MVCLGILFLVLVPKVFKALKGYKVIRDSKEFRATKVLKDSKVFKEQ